MRRLPTTRAPSAGVGGSLLARAGRAGRARQCLAIFIRREHAVIGSGAALVVGHPRSLEPETQGWPIPFSTFHPVGNLVIANFHGLWHPNGKGTAPSA
jgi:hypothetical protein